MVLLLLACQVLGDGTGPFETPPDEVEVDCESGDTWQGVLPIYGEDAAAIQEICGSYTRVDGDLNLRSPLATEGLWCLCEVTGDVNVEYGRSLSLYNLRSIGGSLVLDDFDGSAWELPALESIGGDITLRRSALLSLELPALQELGGTLWLQDVDHLEVLDFDGPTLGGLALRSNNELVAVGTIPPVAGPILVEGNPVLADLGGLAPSLSAGTLELRQNPLLESLAGLEGISEAESLVVQDMVALEDLQGLSGLVKVGDLELANNPHLARPAGLGSLKLVTGSLTVDDNDGMLGLQGLAGVHAVGLDLVISDNALLTDVSALHGVTAIPGELRVVRNPSLPDAAIYALVQAIGQENIGTIVVLDNGG